MKIDTKIRICMILYIILITTAFLIYLKIIDFEFKITIMIVSAHGFLIIILMIQLSAFRQSIREVEEEDKKE